MTDPFRELHEPIRPVDPDPAFAARLRTRLERALALPRGVAAVTATATPEIDTAPTTAPRSAAVPYLAVADARAAIDWYVDVFGARLAEDPIVMPDGRIGHSDLELSGGHVYLSDAHPEIGVTAPRDGEASVSLMLPVHDADAVRERAMAAGASGDRPPYDGYGTRNAWIVDPFGHRWGLHSPLAAHAGYRAGDVVHLALTAPDVERTRAFYAAVLGWSYLPDGRVDGSVPSIGFRDGGPQITADLAVDDIDAAVEVVRDAGGAAGDVERHPWGTVAACADNQGTPVRLHELPIEQAAGTPTLTYLTLEVVDSARARDFYGEVAGWRFTPGRVDDGWQVQGPSLMVGMAGGHDDATAVPVWTVPDLAGALAVVRGEGGTTGDPHREPYGLTAECTDDQGLRFTLVEA